MSSIIFNCKFCKYKTNKKFNLNRHITNKHIDKIIEIEEEIKEEIEEEEIKEEEIEEEEIYNCVKCDKNYKTIKYFNNHQKNCNGLNILSCSKCMLNFTSRQAKSNHIKKNNCIAKSIINNINNHQKIINNDNETKEFIYLLQEREFIKTKEPIYKIGKTKQEKLKRIKSYPNGSELLLYTVCNNCDEIEKTIINKFKSHFIHKKDIGNEYFKGDYNSMIYLIYDIIISSKKEDIKDNNENNNENNHEVNRCSKCNKFYKTKKYLISHEPNCNGINILSCPKCMSTFTLLSNKSKHIKKNNCKAKSINHNIIMNDDYIKNYGNERIDYLEDFINKPTIKDLPIHKKLIKYIEYKYFNEEFPENRNIKYENNNCLIREDGKWKSKNLNNMIIDIIEKNKLIIIYNNFIEYTEEDNEKEIIDNYKYIKDELKVLIKSSKSI
jgi:hypothetical protein